MYTTTPVQNESYKNQIISKYLVINPEIKSANGDIPFYQFNELSFNDDGSFRNICKQELFPIIYENKLWINYDTFLSIEKYLKDTYPEKYDPERFIPKMGNLQLVPQNNQPLITQPLKLILTPKPQYKNAFSDEECDKFIESMFNDKKFIKSVSDELEMIPQAKAELLVAIYFAPKPKIAQFLCCDIASYLVNSGRIRFSDQKTTYLYNYNTKLYSYLNNASTLTNIITTICYEVCDLYSKMRFYISNLEPTEMTKYIDDILTENNGKFLNNIKSPGQSIPFAVFSHVNSYFSTANPVPWLNEEGYPGFLPTCDGKVIEIFDNENFIMSRDRTSQHAFMENCTLLSMKYTSTEIIDAIKIIKLHTEGLCTPRFRKFIELIEDISNRNVVTFQQIMYLFGVILSGKPMKALPCLFSSWTDSGKTTITKLQKHLLGNKAQSFDHGLISFNGPKAHQTEKMRLRGIWLAILDETAKTEKFQYNDKELQILTAGPGTEIGGRLANASEVGTHKLVTTLEECSNYRGGQPFRKYLIEFKSGYCNNLAGPYKPKWYKNQATGELKDALMEEGAIKLINPNVLNDIIYNREESLYMLAWCIVYSNQRFCNPQIVDDLITPEDPEDDCPASLMEFMDQKEYKYIVTQKDLDLLAHENRMKQNINSSGSDIEALCGPKPKRYHNPYTYTAPKNTPTKYMVNFKDYYDQYKQYCTLYLQDTKALTRHTVKDYLKDKGLMVGDKVRFYTKFPIQLQALGEIFNVLYKALDDDVPTSSGILRSEVHKDVATYIETISENKKKEDPNFLGWWCPEPDDILSWVKTNAPYFINRSGTSSGRMYYHVRRIMGFVKTE